MLSKSRVVQLLIMLAVLLILFTWKTVQDKEVKKEELEQATEQYLTVCDFNSECIIDTTQGSFQLLVDDPILHPEQWINFILQSDVQDWKVIDAKTMAKEMFMGRIPVKFEADDSGNYSAKTLVGSCSNAQMTWQLTINVESNGVKETLLFDFVVINEKYSEAS